MPSPTFILHVEDDHDDVDLLRTAFDGIEQELSIKVIIEGHKVIPWLQEQEVLPDVIVMDLNLPKMHGKEILAALKSNEKLGDIPVVVLTTSSSNEERKFCKDHGAREFITKPSTVKGFKDAVELILKTAAA